jgi:hypothetical protein
VLTALAERIGDLEQRFARLGADLEAQRALIEALETERSAQSVRLASITAAHAERRAGGLLVAAAHRIALIGIVFCFLGAVATVTARWFGVALPLNEPIVTAAFLFGAISGVLAMAFHRMQ